MATRVQHGQAALVGYLSDYRSAVTSERHLPMEKPQSSSHKAGNTVRLAGILLGHLVAVSVVVSGDELTAMLSVDSARQLLRTWPIGLLALIAGLLVNQLSPIAKARLVFLRWNHPYPGCRAFTEHADRDVRVNKNQLEKKLGPLPTSPAEQNSLWYKIYRTVGDPPSIVESHRNFLFYRDFTTLVALLTPTLSLGVWVVARSLPLAAAVVAGLCFEFLLVARAARTSGVRFVCNVLALYSAEHT